MNVVSGLVFLAAAFPSGHCATHDDCNRAYWKPLLIGTQIVSSDHVPAKRIPSRKLSFLDRLGKPRRIIGPSTPVTERAVDTRRITVMVDKDNIVIDVDCF